MLLPLLNFYSPHFLLDSAAVFPVKEVQEGVCYPKDDVEDRIEIYQQMHQVLRESLRMAGVINGSGS